MSKPALAIPNKAAKDALPAMHRPPVGTEFYQMARPPGGAFWDVWAVRVLPGGNLEAEKVVELTTYDLARLEVGRRTIESQMRSVEGK